MTGQILTGTGAVGNGGSYESSFGNLPNGTVYSDFAGFKSMAETDMRPQINEAVGMGFKALSSTAGGLGTAGYAMIPISVDPKVIDTSRKNTPLVELVPRVTNIGTTADYNNATAKGAAFTAAEDASMAEVDNTFDRYSTAIKYVYAVGRVTGQAQAGFPSYVMAGFQPAGGAVSPFSNAAASNAKQLDILLATRAIKEKEEDLIINGNTSTATEYNGIIALMSTTNTVDKSTAAVGLNDIDTAIQYAFDDGGRPNLAVCSSGVYTDIMKLLNAKIGYLQSTQKVFWGFSAIVLHTMVGDIPVIPSMFMSNVSGSKAIYFLDMSVVEMRVLQDLTYEDLAHTNDSNKFMLKMYEALIIRNTAFCSSITAISA